MYNHSFILNNIVTVKSRNLGHLFHFEKLTHLFHKHLLQPKFKVLLVSNSTNDHFWGQYFLLLLLFWLNHKAEQLKYNGNGSVFKPVRKFWIKFVVFLKTVWIRINNSGEENLSHSFSFEIAKLFQTNTFFLNLGESSKLWKIKIIQPSQRWIHTVMQI